MLAWLNVYIGVNNSRSTYTTFSFRITDAPKAKQGDEFNG